MAAMFQEEKLRKFLDELQDDADCNYIQRRKANEDMRFIYAPKGHWEDFLEDKFQKRVKLQIDITTPYKNRFIAEYNSNRMGVEFKPEAENTTDDDAELITGIRNADFQQFSGKMSQDNAVEEVAVCGYGCYKLATKFEDEEDAENDNQRIEYRPIYNAYNSVIWDSAAKRIDKRDARRVVELSEYDEKSFEETFPGKNPVSAYTPDDLRWLDFLSCNKKPVFVATRYETIRKKVPVWVYQNLKTETIQAYFKEDHEKIKDELAEDENVEFVRERKIIRQTVLKTVFSGDAILEPSRRIVGKYLPIIPIYGYRGFVDGTEYYRGLIRGLKDPQRMFNVQISQLAENACSNGQSKPIFDPDQITTDISALWADMTNKPYMLAKSLRDREGGIVQTGPIGVVPPAQLDQSTAALMEIIPNYIQQATGGAPQDTMDPKTSGKAIQALIKRENKDTQPIMDNIANSIVWEGEVYRGMVEEIYSTPRMLRVLGKDGTESRKRLLEEVLDRETGKTVLANNLRGKKFLVRADVGAQYETVKEQMVEELKGMLDALQTSEAGAKYTPAVVAMILQNITGPGLDPLKKLVRQDMILQGLVKPETDEEKQLFAQAQGQKGDSRGKALEAVANQANAEARERDSKTLVNAADANKKGAETEEILAKIEREDAKTLAEIRREILENVEGLPLN
ncbi:MAG: portal protein [Nitrospinales bacterium]